MCDAEDGRDQFARAQLCRVSIPNVTEGLVYVRQLGCTTLEVGLKVCDLRSARSTFEYGICYFTCCGASSNLLEASGGRRSKSI